MTGDKLLLVSGAANGAVGTVNTIGAVGTVNAVNAVWDSWEDNPNFSDNSDTVDSIFLSSLYAFCCSCSIYDLMLDYDGNEDHKYDEDYVDDV